MHSNKKILSLFFVSAALMQFASTKPMLRKFFACFRKDPCGKPSSRTKITDLPTDCLCEIFQFCAKNNKPIPKKKKKLPPSSLTLRLVCKLFRDTIDTKPCFLASEDNASATPLFLPYILTQFDFTWEEKVRVKLYNENVADAFANNPFLPSKKEKKLDIQMKLKLYEKNKISSYLEKLLPKLEGFSFSLDIRLWGVSPLNVNYSIINNRIIFAKGNPLSLTLSNKNNIYECNLLKMIRLENLKNLCELNIEYCNQFNGVEIENLANLCKLTIDSCNQFNEILKMENLIKLEKLRVMYCHNFIAAGLEKLPNLGALEVNNCDKFNRDSDTVKKLRNRECHVIIWPPTKS